MGTSRASARLPDHPVLRVVEILPVGAALYHGALESQLFHRPLELIGGGLRVLGGQARKTRKASGVLPNDFCLCIVDLLCLGDGGLRVGVPLNAGGAC